MIEIFLNNKKITDNCGSLNVSKSKIDVCKKITLNILKNEDIKINLSDTIKIAEENKVIFYGFIFHLDVDDNSTYISVTAYDPLVYLKKSKIKDFVFENKATSEIIQSILGETGGLELGNNDLKDEEITLNLKEKTLYDGLKEVVEKVHDITSEDYLIIFEDMKIHFNKLGFKSSHKIKWTEEIEVGTLLSKKYTESLENMINTVYILNEDDSIKEIKTSDLTKFGTIATTFKPDKDGKENVESKFKGIDTTLDVSVIGSFDFCVGAKVDVEINGNSTEFFIESESHNYSDGIHISDLTLIKEWDGEDN